MYEYLLVLCLHMICYSLIHTTTTFTSSHTHTHILHIRWTHFVIDFHANLARNYIKLWEKMKQIKLKIDRFCFQSSLIWCNFGVNSLIFSSSSPLIAEHLWFYFNSWKETKRIFMWKIMYCCDLSICILPVCIVKIFIIRSFMQKTILNDKNLQKHKKRPFEDEFVERQSSIRKVSKCLANLLVN